MALASCQGIVDSAAVNTEVRVAFRINVPDVFGEMPEAEWLCLKVVLLPTFRDTSKQYARR